MTYKVICNCKTATLQELLLLAEAEGHSGKSDPAREKNYWWWWLGFFCCHAGMEWQVQGMGTRDRIELSLFYAAYHIISLVIYIYIYTYPSSSDPPLSSSNKPKFALRLVSLLDPPVPVFDISIVLLFIIMYEKLLYTISCFCLFRFSTNCVWQVGP